MRRGQVLHYAGWMLLDRVLPRYGACLLISSALLLPLHFTMSTNPPPLNALPRVLASVHQVCAIIFVLLFANGLISTDRLAGYFRFYFARPASPLWFYGQHTVLALAGTLAASASLIGMFAIAVAPVWTFSLLLGALALFCLVGVPVVIFSALSRHDWVWAIVAWMVGSYLRARFAAGDSWFGAILNALLPPYQVLSVDHRVTGWEWAWLAAWSAGVIAATLLVLARRPLAED